MPDLNSPTVILILVIIGIGAIIIIISNYNKKIRDLTKQQQEMYKQLYPNRNYECKGYQHYIMSDRDKINYLFDILTQEEREKLIRYGENIYKTREAQKYNKQP